MKTKLTPIAAAAAVALAGAIAPALAQTAPAPASAASASAKGDGEVQHVEVTGIRGSLQQSLSQKRNADSHVDVITAEDIGKLPDKNVADSLQHVPGVTISSAGANEGGFDENDRVSMRGTSPSLTQTLLNGHNVASGDWFVLNQTSTVGRSVSYTLLPSEVVGSIVVHKSSQASLVEGGVAGSVDIITRKPLEFSKPFSADASVGAVYSDLPSKTDGQFSGLLNWKNEASTFGVLLQAFSETRHLRRDGAEELGYEQIAANSALATAHPDLANVYYPTLIGSAFFEQVRKRTGGLVDIEVKPNESTTLDVNYFQSRLQASNYNRNYMLWLTHILAQGNGQQPTDYTVRNGTLVSASFAPTDPLHPDAAGNPGKVVHGIYDMVSRPGEESDTRFFDVDGKFVLTDKLTLKTQIGTTIGMGKTPKQDVMEMDINNTGGQYQLNGINSAPDWSLPGGDTSTPANATLDWIFGDDDVKNIDKESWAQVDAEYAVEAGPLVDVKFGARATDHHRTQNLVVNQRPIVAATGAPSPFDAANYPQTYQNYPSNYASGLGGTMPRNVWYYSPADLAAFDAKFANRDPVNREDWTQEFALKEGTAAGYIQGDLEGKGWSGDVGLRIVNTTENVMTYQAAQKTTPGAIIGIDSATDTVGSAFGTHVAVITQHSYTDVLPSGNLKFDLTKDMVLRFAASRTMTRADYSALAGAVSLGTVTGNTGSGSGGNPDLKPVTSNNFDASFEWYFAPRALVSISPFYMDLTSYIGYGHTEKSYVTYDGQHPNGQLIDYTLTTPVNSKGKVKGVEFAYEQPLFNNFGVSANYTYTDAHEDGGGPLVGASKNTYNLGAYFENDLFNARVAWNHRSAFYSGLDRSTAFYQAAEGDLSATLGWTVNKSLSITVDGRNLNNPKLKYYALNEDQPRSTYQNGRQYFLTARIKY